MYMVNLSTDWWHLIWIPCDTEGKTVKLKLKWKSFNGEKTAEFDYCTRKSTPANSAAITAGRSVLRLK